MPTAFADTNILVYAADESSPLATKTVIARELLLLRDLHYSVQVLNEFVAVARHPKKLNLSKARERRWLKGWLSRPVAELDAATFVRALDIHHRFQLSHWDSLIIASALMLNCSVIYTEDLTHGQNYDGVTAHNPFL